MKMNMESMKITKAVLERIEGTIGQRLPECGGVLGAGEDGVISEYYFDHDGKGSKHGYAPDVEGINHMLEAEWMPRGVYMTGIVHSHENGVGVPSCCDVGYGARILQALDTVDVFYLPIVTIDEQGVKLHAHMLQRDAERGFVCRQIPLEVTA